jgi:hypothetical protein
LNKIGDENVPIAGKIDNFRLAGPPVVKDHEKFSKKYVRALTLKQVANKSIEVDNMMTPSLQTSIMEQSNESDLSAL